MPKNGNLILIGDVFVRLFLPFFIWRNPVLATILAVLVDTVDGLLFSVFTDFSREDYQKLDKILDQYFLTVAVFFLWGRTPFFYLYLPFYLLRLIGVIILYITDEERVLVFFPNAAGMLFFLYIFTLWQPQFSWIFAGKFSYFLVLLVLLMKVPQEYWMHRRRFCLRTSLLTLLGHKNLANFVSPSPPRANM